MKATSIPYDPTGLPSAAVGALLALRLFGMDLSLIAMIGLLMLIGIVKKNAIMMIDVALTTQREGQAPADAIHEAAVLRFRPIMMTTLAALFGALPIAIGAGAGAEFRQPLGVAMVGGLLVSQVLTLFMTPVLYIYMERLASWVRSTGSYIVGARHPDPANRLCSVVRLALRRTSDAVAGRSSPRLHGQQINGQGMKTKQRQVRHWWQLGQGL